MDKETRLQQFRDYVYKPLFQAINSRVLIPEESDMLLGLIWERMRYQGEDKPKYRVVMREPFGPPS